MFSLTQYLFIQGFSLYVLFMQCFILYDGGSLRNNRGMKMEVDQTQNPNHVQVDILFLEMNGNNEKQSMVQENDNHGNEEQLNANIQELTVDLFWQKEIIRASKGKKCLGDNSFNTLNNILHVSILHFIILFYIFKLTQL